MIMDDLFNKLAESPFPTARLFGRRKRLLQAYRAVFTTDDGKLVLRHLLKECNVINPIFTDDPNECLRLEGQRRVGMSVLKAVYSDEQKQAEEITEGTKDNEDQII